MNAAEMQKLMLSQAEQLSISAKQMASDLIKDLSGYSNEEIQNAEGLAESLAAAICNTCALQLSLEAASKKAPA